jgi:FlaA1/EpsC-like NDP-sugar epimerase
LQKLRHGLSHRNKDDTNLKIFPAIPTRGLIVFTHDIFMAAVSFIGALYLRIGSEIFDYPSEILIQGIGAFALIAAGVFLFMDLYSGVWRYASLNDLLAITRSVTLVILIFLLVMFTWTRFEDLPRSLPVINWGMLIALLGGPRFFYRLIKDRRFEFVMEDENHRRIPVLLVGAGDDAEQFIRALERQSNACYRVVGIVAERAARVGRKIHDIQVLGTTVKLDEIVASLERQGRRPERLILTYNTMNGAKVTALLNKAGALGMTLARLPKLTDFKIGISSTSLDVKPVAVEDLLGRPQAALDQDAMSNLIKGRKVLITGAGGSIGSELARQISGLAPAELILLDNSEFNLYSIDMDLSSDAPLISRRALLADVRDLNRLNEIFSEVSPELVFHAAALKHVPMVEANVIEGARTNIRGTANVAECCISAGVQAMVLISTDKAVNPTSIMGATKRIAESYCQALDLERGEGDGTRFITVRFGNVLGSTGSVVPLFEKQLRAGGPLTVTHADMTRYFMTVKESVELVLQASAFGTTAFKEDGKIFVLDMGEPVLIFDLAKQIIRLAGLKPDEDIKIEFTGLRPGEKLFEEIFHGKEAPVPTVCPGVLLAAPRTTAYEQLANTLQEIEEACATGNTQNARAAIEHAVPEFIKPS